jgi:hypothetical protein
MNDKNQINNKNFSDKGNLTNNSNNSNNNYKDNINNYNNYATSLQQSPKIRTGRYRPQSSRPRPISLLDIDDKKYISKGTNLNAQYNRLSEKQFSKCVDALDLRAGDNKNKKNLIQNYINRNDKKCNIKSKTVNQEDNSIKNNNKKKSKNLTIETKESFSFNKKKSDKNLQKIKMELQENTNNKKKTFNRPLSAQLRQKKDSWLPKGYPEYEYCVLNPKYFKENLKKNPFINKEHIYNIKEIKQKSDKSDIFFLGPQSEKETKLLVIGNEEKSKNYNTKLGSDVFNLKNDFTNLMKSSETYLFKNKNYPISTESKSFWTPRANIPTYINSPSVQYNIINPKAKCNTKTKEAIFNECMKKKKDDNNNDINYMNPIFRQKNISSFYDITKGGMNRNHAYEKIYHDNPRSFYRKNDICTVQYDLFKNYQGIIEKPFMTIANKKIQI